MKRQKNKSRLRVKLTTSLTGGPKIPPHDPKIDQRLKFTFQPKLKKSRELMAKRLQRLILRALN